MRRIFLGTSAILFSLATGARLHAEGFPALDPPKKAARALSNAETGTVLGEPAATEAAPAAKAAPPDEFNPFSYRYSLGLEGAALSGTSVLQETAVAVGYWMDRRWGFETYVGYAKSASTATETTGASVNALTNASTTTRTYTGAAPVGRALIGGALKYRIYQRKHFGVSTDFLLTFMPGSSASYLSGSEVITVPDTNSPSNYTVSQAAYGTVVSELSSFLRFGPRMTVDYHLPFLPNLLLGATFGIFASVGGTTTTTSPLRTQTYAVVNGVAQPPTSDSTVTSVVQSSPGLTSNTYGLGGTGVGLGSVSFNPITVTGTFRIRYTF